MFPEGTRSPETLLRQPKEVSARWCWRRSRHRHLRDYGLCGLLMGTLRNGERPVNVWGLGPPVIRWEGCSRAYGPCQRDGMALRVCCVEGRQCYLRDLPGGSLLLKKLHLTSHLSAGVKGLTLIVFWYWVEWGLRGRLSLSRGYGACVNRDRNGKYTEGGSPDSERQTPYVLSHLWILTSDVLDRFI